MCPPYINNMSTAEMENESEHNTYNFTANYKPVQRVSEACQECRKKKSRCTGERPKCKHCRRLARKCIYPSSVQLGKPSIISSNEALHNLVSSVQDISNRLENIERLLHSRSDIAELAQDSLETPENSDHVRLQMEANSYCSASLSHITAKNDSSSVGSNVDESFKRVSFSNLVPLPVVLELVDLFFTHCHNQPYCFFHEANFRQSFSAGSVPDHLMLAILASAVRYSDNPFFEDKDEVAEIYAYKSWNCIVSSHFAANLGSDIRTVQTITLLAIFDFTDVRGHLESAWIKLGLSVRIAQNLKLMIENATQLSNSEQEERRRVFWSVYLLDRLVSCGRGCPPAILDASCQLQLPCDEITWKLGWQSETLTLEDISHRIPPKPEQWSPLANVVAASYTLSRGAQYMLQQYNIRNRDPPWDANSDFASILSDLLYLENLLDISRSPKEVVAQCTFANGQIDQQCAGPAIFARALFHLCYCLLHHPFLLRKRLESCQMVAPSSFLSYSFSIAWEHSKSIVNLLHEFRNVGAIAHIPFYWYCTLVAGTIAGLYLNKGSDLKRTESALILKKSRTILQDTKYWKNVSSMELALEHFCNNSHKFDVLVSDLPTTTPLSPEDSETLWGLIDYSTMSNISCSDFSFSFATNATMPNPFGEVIVSNFAL